MVLTLKFFFCKKYIGPTADPDFITWDWVKAVFKFLINHIA